MPTVIESSHLRRRTWLTGSVALAFAALSAPARAALPAPPTRRLTLLTAWDSNDQSWAGLWTPGAAPRGLALPARAHEVLPIPGKKDQALVVARRPGEFLVRMDTRRARALQWHDMEPDRLLCGHAAFSRDGTTLYTSETDVETGTGLIVARDPVTLRKRREFSSGGVGPHAVLVEPQGTLLVANGGLLTLPETGRRKLNQVHMDSSLARLDAVVGEVLQSWRLNDRSLSLRHLARAPDGTVAVALQAEHTDEASRNRAPLLALLEASGLRAVDLPDSLLLNGYAGDVAYVAANRGAADETGRFVVSATRAGQLAWWSAQGQWLGQYPLPDAGALSSVEGEWLACGGDGQLRGQLQNHAYNHAQGGPGNPSLELRASGLKWDNHARWVS